MNNNNSNDFDKKPQASMLPVYIYLVLAAIFVGSLFYFMFIKKHKGGKKQERSGTTTPALQTPAKQPSPPGSPAMPSVPTKKWKIDRDTMEKQVKEKIKQFPGRVGFVFYDFETGSQVKINENEVFESASLVKLPIMLEVFKRIDKNTLQPGHILTMKKRHQAGGSGILKSEKPGSKYTVQRLTDLMITQSDNTATDMLIEFLGMEKIEKTAEKVGMSKTTLRRKIFDFDQIDRGDDNLTTPQDISAFFKYLYQGESISEKQRAEMINVLKNQKRNNMIPRYLPKNVQCAHKTGSLTGIVHDCGLVYIPDRKPYVLILMSKNVNDKDKAEKMLAEISKTVYDNVK